MKLNLNVIVLITVILSFCAFASYEYVGDDDFMLGTGNFNSNLLDVTSATRILSNPQSVPLMSDLDGNGINEIILLDNHFIKIYQGKELTPAAALGVNCYSAAEISAYSTLLGAESLYTSLAISDLNSDGNKDVIVFCPSKAEVHIFNFDSENLTMVSNYSTTITANEGVLGCAENQTHCMISYVEGEAEIYFLAINFTDNSPQRKNNSFASRTHCYPRFRYIETADYDRDGNIEYIVSYVRGGTVPSVLYIDYYEIDSTTYETSLDMRISDNTFFFTAGSGYCTLFRYGRYFTEPLVADFTSNAGYETAIGIMESETTFKIYIYDMNGNKIDEFPEVLTADGQIVSNVVLIDAFPDTGTNDVCVLGMKNSSSIIDLLCGNTEQAWYEFDASEFEYDISGLHNVSWDYGNFNIMIHGTQQSQDRTDGTDLSEIVTAWGVFSLDFGLLSNELVREYPNPLGEEAIIMMLDVEGNGLTDMIAVSDTNIWYIDDGFSNSYGYIDTSNGLTTINPCIDAVWKENTSVSVNVQVSDIDGDDVCANAFLYYGSAYQQNGTLICGGEGSVFSFYFTANQTISSGVLRMIGYDVENNQSIQDEEYRFTVSTNGIEYGDCVSILDLDPQDGSGTSTNDTDTGTGLDSTPNQANNSINNVLVAPLVESTNLGTGIIWLIIMIIVEGFLVYYLYDKDPSALIFSSIFIQACMLVIGYKLGYVSTGIVVMVGVVSVIGIGLFIHRMIVPK